MQDMEKINLKELEQLLSLDKDALLVKLGEETIEQQNIRYAFPPSDAMKKRTGDGSWKDFRKNHLCPFVRTNAAFRILLSGAPGIKVLERAGSITLGAC